MCHAYEFVRCPNDQACQGRTMHDEHFGTKITVVDTQARRLLGLFAIEDGDPTCSIIFSQLKTTGSISTRASVRTSLTLRVPTANAAGYAQIMSGDAGYEVIRTEVLLMVCIPSRTVGLQDAKQVCAR